ncbi:hypothetical protein TNCV_3767801 [Trichonephila clavipes]|nr:hypothetical protein TNCV_3767801 [Trichonephila clavipes]
MGVHYLPKLQRPGCLLHKLQPYAYSALQSGNRSVPGPDCIVDALKFPNQAPRASGESLPKSVAWRCPDGTQHLFCWPILAFSGQLLASDGPVVDSRYLNSVFGQAEATPNK